MSDKEMDRKERKEAGGIVDNIQKKINEQLDKFVLQRSELTDNTFFAYPLDLNGTAEATGLPFIRFGFGGTKGTNQVAIFLYQPPGISVNDSTNYTGMNIGTIRGGAGLVRNFAQGN